MTIAVTGLSAADNPAPGVAVARAIRQSSEFRGTLIGLTFDHRHTGLYASRIFDELFVIPPPARGAEAFVSALREISRSHPIQVLFPTLDPEVLLAAKSARELRGFGIRCLLPDERQIKRRAKPVLPELAKRFGFGSPKTLVLASRTALGVATQTFPYPFYLKGSFTDAQLIKSQAEAEWVFARLQSQWGLPLLAQERISGEELDLAVLADTSHRLVGAVPMKKLGVTDRGKGWAGTTVLLPEVVTKAGLLMRSLRWVGPAEIEMIHDPVSGIVHLIEINPRFPAWIAFTPHTGQNLPWMAVKLAMGLSVEPVKNYTVGALFTRTVEDFFHPVERMTEFALAETAR
jgi:carbamoyl-phosphate synthase large subunit